jgi:hypothetical protein
MIDLMSRLHSRSPPVPSSQEATDAVSVSAADSAEQAEDGEGFNAMRPAIVDDGLPQSLLLGASSLRPMLRKSGACISLQHSHVVDSLNEKLVESRIPTLLTEETVSAQRAAKPSEPSDVETLEVLPGRMVTDRLVNIFLQEYAPLFPILHSPTFLALYEAYVDSAGQMKDAEALAQLNLVFAISELSSQARTPNRLKAFLICHSLTHRSRRPRNSKHGGRPRWSLSRPTNPLRPFNAYV